MKRAGSVSKISRVRWEYSCGKAQCFANPTAAINTVSRITKAMRGLIDFPDMGTPLSSIVDARTDYRFLVCRAFLVFYRHENGVVYVVRVLYGRRDYLKTLLGDLPDEE